VDETIIILKVILKRKKKKKKKITSEYSHNVPRGSVILRSPACGRNAIPPHANSAPTLIQATICQYPVLSLVSWLRRP
jgi:hypothetical protein